MNRIVVLLAGVALGAVAVFFWIRPHDDVVGHSDVRGAYARAVAYYLNETNANDRRARMELLPFARSHGQDPAWLMNMANIDLAELNHPVQSEDHILGEPRTYLQLLRSAVQRLERARALAPNDAAIAFNLARTYKKLAPHADDQKPLINGALELLRPLAESDTSDPAALIQYAEILQVYRQDFQAAFDAYDRVVARGADFVPETQWRVSELRRATCLLRLDSEKGMAELNRIDATYEKRVKPKADSLERGAYTKLRKLGISPPAQPDPRRMNWREVTARTLLPKLGEQRFLIAPDLDGDCARDIVMNSVDGLRVLHNRRNATFEDVTEPAGFPKGLVISSAAAGDINNDGLVDLVVGGPGGVSVFLNRTDVDALTEWKFERLPAFPEAAGVTSVAFWDLDHDGDLDIVIDAKTVYRTALEETHAGVALSFTKVVLPLPKTGAVPSASHMLILDVDDDHDTDLLVLTSGGNFWFDNLREMKFARRPLPDGDSLGVFDVDNDFREEVRIGDTVYDFIDGEFQPLFQRVALLDLDGDGLADKDPLGGIELRGKFESTIASDLNRDGSGDLIVVTNEGLTVYMSRPERAAAWIDVRPRGGATNADGIGTKVRVFAGDLRLGATCRDGLLSFAIGRRTLVDCILLRWTNGVEQGVVMPNVLQCLDVDEREGEVGSCPFVYTWDGERWQFIADVQSGVPLGLPVADGVYLNPRSNETILIPGAALRPDNGRLKVDVTEEFRELFYMDSVVLRAIDHPADVRPVLNEGFTAMKFPEFRVHGLTELRPPVRATDHKGRDHTAVLQTRDRKHAVVFEKLTARQYEGLAQPWSIELDFGDVRAAERVLLVMDGWVEFPTASASIAASQSKTVHFQMPVLDRQKTDGTWERIHNDPGFPAGKTKSVLVDLTGKVPAGPLVLRISSTQRLHWDAFFLATGPDQKIRLTELPLVVAKHEFHGVGKRVEDPSGELPWRYHHDELEKFYRWDQMPMGLLSKYGDVRELLAKIDDRYPILASGDCVRLEFDAGALPPLPEGWVRDWCITTEGWVKDADMNQAVRESVGPLPFHAMSKYPYDPATEAHPDPEWQKEWLTRPARKLVNPAALGAK